MSHQCTILVIPLRLVFVLWKNQNFFYDAKERVHTANKNTLTANIQVLFPSSATTFLDTNWVSYSSVLSLMTGMQHSPHSYLRTVPQNYSISDANRHIRLFLLLTNKWVLNSGNFLQFHFQAWYLLEWLIDFRRPLYLIFTHLQLRNCQSRRGGL